MIMELVNVVGFFRLFSTVTRNGIPYLGERGEGRERFDRRRPL